MNGSIKYKLLQVLFVMEMSMLIHGCTTSFINPPASDAGQSVSIAPYLGDWMLAGIGGETPDDDVMLTISQEAGGDLRFDASDGEKIVVGTIRLVSIEGRVYFSEQQQEPEQKAKWNVGQVILQNNNEELLFKVPAAETLAAAINAGDLSGEVIEDDEENLLGATMLVTVDSSAEELRQYLSDNDNVCVIPAILLKRPANP